MLPLRNGGPGVALNVEGQVRLGTQGEVSRFYACSIAPALGGCQHPRRGVRYSDLNDDRWITRFTIKRGEGANSSSSTSCPAGCQPSPDRTAE